MICGVNIRHGLDPALLWLWCRLAAIAPVQPLAWELPYAGGAALKCKKTFFKQVNSCPFPNSKTLNILTAVSSQDEDMGHFEIPDPMEESTTSLVSSSTSAYSSFPVDVVVYVRVQVIYLIYLFLF